jgi:uncharacterized protein (UPF0147 family)
MTMQDVIISLEDISCDAGTSKRFKAKATEVICLLQQDSQVAVEKALQVLEELSSLEMSSYHRTQVWEVVSMLESKH